MHTNRQLSLAVRHALATGAIAVCAAGRLVAHAQQAPAGNSSDKAQSAKADSRDSQAVRVAQAAPNGNSAGVAQLQEVVITGSLIQRTSIETPNPVQVLSSKDLMQSGYTDVSDVLRNLPSNGASTLSQSFSFAFASGASGAVVQGNPR